MPGGGFVFGVHEDFDASVFGTEVRGYDAADAFVGNENILYGRYQRFGDDSNIYIMAKVGTDGRIALKHELDMIDDEFIFDENCDAFMDIQV